MPERDDHFGFVDRLLRSRGSWEQRTLSKSYAVISGEALYPSNVVESVEERVRELGDTAKATQGPVDALGLRVGFEAGRNQVHVRLHSSQKVGATSVGEFDFVHEKIGTKEDRSKRPVGHPWSTRLP